MDVFERLYIFSFLLVPMLTTAQGQQCLRSNHTNGTLPTLRDYSNTHLIQSTILQHNQVIIPSYRFHCHGNITEWGIGVQPQGNNNNQNRYNLDLQVWRPSPTVATDGCYSLVGNNRFSSVLANAGLLRATPLPQNRIQFRQGDVLGFFIENRFQSSSGVTALNDFEQRGDGGFETEEVWYGDSSWVSSHALHCPYPIGPHGVLNTFTNAAPVISVSLSTCIYPSFTSAPANDMTITSIKPSQTDISIQASSTSTITYKPTPKPVYDSAADSVTNISTGIIVGITAGIFLLITVIALTLVVISVVFCHKRKKTNTYLDRNASMIGNAAYIGTTFENPNAQSRYSEFHAYDHLCSQNVIYNGRIYENANTQQSKVLTYDYPRFNAKADKKKKTPVVAAHARPSTTYVMLNITAKRNEAYADPSTNSLEYSYVHCY